MTAAIPSQRHIPDVCGVVRKLFRLNPLDVVAPVIFLSLGMSSFFYYTANADRPYITAVVLTALVYQRENAKLERKRQARG